MIWIFISLMAKDIENFIVSQSFEISLLIILCLDMEPIFNLDFWFLLISSFWSSLCIMDFSPLSYVELTKIFVHSEGCYFILLTTVSVALEKPFNIMRS